MLTNKALETGMGSGRPLATVHPEGSTDARALSVPKVKNPGGEYRKGSSHSCRTEIDRTLLSNERAYELSTCS